MPRLLGIEPRPEFVHDGSARRLTHLEMLGRAEEVGVERSALDPVHVENEVDRLLRGFRRGRLRVEETSAQVRETAGALATARQSDLVVPRVRVRHELAEAVAEHAERRLAGAAAREDGFAPNLRANVEAIEVILAAIDKAGFAPGKDVVLALDPAASEFYEDGAYVLAKSDKSRKTSADMVAFWADWVRQYPIWSIEDGLAEQDWDGWRLLTEQLGGKLQLVGDDIFVTNPAIVREAIEKKVANSVLIKLNQIGSVSETLECMRIARAAQYGTVVSHRSGETADDFIADFTVATGAGQLKTGAPCRGERVAKYNQLMRIEEELGSQAQYAGPRPFAPTRADR
jgi:phosphopyruvate hydratase